MSEKKFFLQKTEKNEPDFQLITFFFTLNYHNTKKYFHCFFDRKILTFEFTTIQAIFICQKRLMR
jgi:hypothetical protein